MPWLRSRLLPLLFFIPIAVSSPAEPRNGLSGANRLVYLEENDPFYPGRDFPKLITPQWVGEPGVEAVVILAIDDLTETGKWERFLRPILERLKRIDGRAPVSIMAVKLDPQEPQFQAWLKEGLSLETHTLTHPCPCLARGYFASALSNYDGSIELLNRVPGNHPVAFRMPCCDSMNSPSPRFYAEMFNRANAAGHFLSIDSSVMNILTTNDSALLPSLVRDADGREKYRKYLPWAGFATTIEDYPYPYVIGKLCWEFPCAVPSDWEAQHYHGTNNPVTIADWKAALDATVIKQGTMTLIFHPHGWIRSEQIVEWIDYAVATYSNRVKFLTFREAQQRLDKNLLNGHSLRAADGRGAGVRLLDLNNDGYLDTIWAGDNAGETRVWLPQTKSWQTTNFPTALVSQNAQSERQECGVRFGIIRSNHRVSAVVHNDTLAAAWTFDGTQWSPDQELLAGLELEGKPVFTARRSADGSMHDCGVRLRDLDGDGICELIVGNDAQNAVFSWSDQERFWKRAPYALPPNASVVDEQGRDNGLRFVDVNEDGFADVLFSNEKSFSLHLFVARPYLGFGLGWSREVLLGKPGQPGAIPMITREGSNNGAWFHERQLCVQNENTAALPDQIERRSFDSLLAGLQPPPLSAEDSLKAIRVRPGFKVELVASEPLVQDPIAFEWGAEGKLWVVEMGDYPLGLDGQGQPGGRVRFLEDTNHDGIYDQSTVFLDGLNFPTGVMPWGRGVIVSAAPEIFYAEDTDGDGKADLRKILFTGFRQGNQQHRLNGFDYGLDNWLYGANGDSGGTIRSAGLTAPKGPPIDIRGRDFRFRPDEGIFQTQAGGTQYGRHRDDWGNWFGNDNSTWLWHYFVPEHYLARNPHLPVRTVKRILAQNKEGTRVFPISRLLQRFNDIGAAGHVTSANSAMPYRDDLFGPEFATSVFISEPVHNLIHREVLAADGVSFTSHRASEELTNEFLASTDNWFRPTMIKTGPDGALYFADMYRLVIEHPEWIPEDVKHRLDLRAGHDKGRLYRVLPAGAALRAVPRLDQLETLDLVAALESPNGWQRDTAQRLLAARADPRALGPLASLVTESKFPKTRLQALCTLEALGFVSPSILIRALRDPHEAVREHAIRISEPWLGDASKRAEPELEHLVEALLSLTEDSAARVRYQLAFTLGEWGDPRAAVALVKIAAETPEHPEIELAVMSSAPRHVAGMLVAALDATGPSNPPVTLLEQLLGVATALGDEHSVAQTLTRISNPESSGFAPWQFAAVASILDALDRRGSTLKKLSATAGVELKQAISHLDGIFDAARSMTTGAMAMPDSPKGSDGQAALLPALRLIGRGQGEESPDLDRLALLLGPHFPGLIQSAALAALRRGAGRLRGEAMVRGWSSAAPGLRAELLGTLLTRREWVEILLGAIEGGEIPGGQIGPSEQQQLRAYPEPALRQRAAKLFAGPNPDRQKLIAAYLKIAEAGGDVTHGAALFEQNCAVCHRQTLRAQVGPDLASLADKPIETLLVAILDPNQAVEARYVNYNALTRDGRELSGIIAAETATSITLRSASGEETLLRNDLEKLSSSGLSLMPEGFEKSLSPQDFADVIAFLKKR